MALEMTITSWEKEEAKLRQLHIDQCRAGKWEQAQRTQEKHIAVLNKIHDLKHSADNLLLEQKQ